METGLHDDRRRLENSPGDSATTDTSTTNPEGSTTTDGGPPPSCTSLPGTVVYIESGDTQEPLLKVLGRKLRDTANISIVFQLTGSCTLSPNLYNGTPIPKNSNMLYIPSTAENAAWTTAMAENTCTTDPNNGTPPNLGIAALFPSSCAGLGTPPAGIGSFTGPIQAYTFIVPTAEFTTQTAISAAEAYYALGDGAKNPVTLNGSPEWNDPTQFFLRPATKSTLVATALNIGLDGQGDDARHGADGGTTDGRASCWPRRRLVLSGVEAATSMQAIGILGDEVYDANRSMGVDVLAFEALRPEPGVLPRLDDEPASTSRTSATVTTRCGPPPCTSRPSTAAASPATLRSRTSPIWCSATRPPRPTAAPTPSTASAPSWTSGSPPAARCR